MKIRDIDPRFSDVDTSHTDVMHGPSGDGKGGFYCTQNLLEPRL